jgi:hypothetical protein
MRHAARCATKDTELRAEAMHEWNRVRRRFGKRPAKIK